MPRPDLRLVEFQRRWQVCRIAQVEEQPFEFDPPDAKRDTYEAWVYGADQTVLCRMGQHESTYPLPDWEPTNFFRDRFPFAIDRQQVGSEFIEKVGGCVNALAAKRAFEMFVDSGSQHTLVTLRHGGRIMCREKGRNA